MLHSTVLKRIGSAVFIFGALLLVAMTACMGILPDLSMYWAYFLTVGVYVIVAGLIIWLIGAGKEYHEPRRGYEVSPPFQSRPTSRQYEIEKKTEESDQESFNGM
jgi:hypothetical protein